MTLLNPYALLGGVTTLALFTLHGAIFLALKTAGDLLERARASRVGSGRAAVLVVVFLLWTYLNAVSAHAKGIVPGVIPITALGLAIAVPFLVRAARDGVAFTATALSILLLTATLFLNLYPRVLVSSTDKAYSLTIWSTSSNHYSLVVMTIVALALTPLVLLYQGWTYYVFRHRISRDDLVPLKTPVELLSGGDDHKPAASNT